MTLQTFTINLFEFPFQAWASPVCFYSSQISVSSLYMISQLVSERGISCIFIFLANLLTPPYLFRVGVEFGARMITIDGKQIKLQIWDTVSNKILSQYEKAWAL
jgi:hypothetical protein